MDTLNSTITRLYEEQIPLYICSNIMMQSSSPRTRCAIINTVHHDTQTIELIDIISSEDHPSLDGEDIRLFTLPAVGSSLQLLATVINDDCLSAQDRTLKAVLHPLLRSLDRRHEVRVAPQRPSQFRVEFKNEWQQRFYGVLQNVSLHGIECCIHDDVSDDLFIGDEVFVRIEAPFINEVMTCRFKILWSSFDCHRQITHIGGVFKSNNRQTLFTLGKFISFIDTENNRKALSDH